MQMRIAEKIFKVRGQMSRSWPDGMLGWRRHAFRRYGVEAHWLFFHVFLCISLKLLQHAVMHETTVAENSVT